MTGGNIARAIVLAISLNLNMYMTYGAVIAPTSCISLSIDPIENNEVRDSSLLLVVYVNRGDCLRCLHGVSDIIQSARHAYNCKIVLMVGDGNYNAGVKINSLYEIGADSVISDLSQEVKNRHLGEVVKTPVFFYLSSSGGASDVISYESAQISGTFEAQLRRFKPGVINNSSTAIAIDSVLLRDADGTQSVFLRSSAVERYGNEYFIVDTQPPFIYRYNSSGNLLHKYDVAKLLPNYGGGRFYPKICRIGSESIAMVLGGYEEPCEIRNIGVIDFVHETAKTIPLSGCDGIFLSQVSSVGYMASEHLFLLPTSRGPIDQSLSIQEKDNIIVLNDDGKLIRAIGRQASDMKGKNMLGEHDNVFLEFQDSIVFVLSKYSDSVVVIRPDGRELYSFSLLRGHVENYTPLKSGEYKDVVQWSESNSRNYSIRAGADGYLYIQYLTRVNGERKYFIVQYDSHKKQVVRESEIPSPLFHIDESSIGYALMEDDGGAIIVRCRI